MSTQTAVVKFASPVIMLLIMWLVRITDFIIPIRFNSLGVRAWDFSHWYGVITMPFLHANWPHLFANSIPSLVLGLLVAAHGVARFWIVTGVVMVTSATSAFVINMPGTLTVGASGLVFGYFGFLIVAAFCASTWGQRIIQAVVALIVMGIYGGSMLMGIVPTVGFVSWQGHLGGLIGGVLAAWLMAKWLRAEAPNESANEISAALR